MVPLPVNEQLLRQFAAFLAQQGLSSQTVKTYLAAIRNLQISLGFPDPHAGHILITTPEACLDGNSAPSEPL